MMGREDSREAGMVGDGKKESFGRCDGWAERRGFCCFLAGLNRDRGISKATEVMEKRRKEAELRNWSVKVRVE